MEFRSLTEDFDTATANGRLQLQMVLAFSEWWRNSIRERSVAGQAKARTEGRFPGLQPSLTEQQREYIKEERSRGVSQRELAKRLEVSRWTIQQVDEWGLGGKCSLGDGFSGHRDRIGIAQRMEAAGAPNAAVQRQGPMEAWSHGGPR